MSSHELARELERLSPLLARTDLSKSGSITGGKYSVVVTSTLASRGVQFVSVEISGNSDLYGMLATERYTAWYTGCTCPRSAALGQLRLLALSTQPTAVTVAFEHPLACVQAKLKLGLAPITEHS